MDSYYNEQSFGELDELFKEYMEKANKATEILRAGADAFVKDLKALPSPKSHINKAGHTHMIDVFGSREENGNILVGWGKYYGPILERGWKTKRGRAPAHPHFKPLFQRNKEKYYNTMIQKLHGGV